MPVVMQCDHVDEAGNEASQARPRGLCSPCRWGRRSWKPWILSLVVEAASAQLLSLATSYRAAGQRRLQSASSDSLGILQSLKTFE